MNYKEQYNSIKSVFNPYFEEEIVFDYSGWNHLQKDGNGLYRDEIILRERLSLIPYLKILLQEKNAPIEPKLKFRKDKNGKEFLIRYFSWIYTIDTELESFRIKIIIRQKGNQTKHFYSCFKLVHNNYISK